MKNRLFLILPLITAILLACGFPTKATSWPVMVLQTQTKAVLPTFAALPTDTLQPSRTSLPSRTPLPSHTPPPTLVPYQTATVFGEPGNIYNPYPLGTEVTLRLIGANQEFSLKVVEVVSGEKAFNMISSQNPGMVQLQGGMQFLAIKLQFNYLRGINEFSLPLDSFKISNMGQTTYEKNYQKLKAPAPEFNRTTHPIKIENPGYSIEGYLVRVSDLAVPRPVLEFLSNDLGDEMTSVYLRLTP